MGIELRAAFRVGRSGQKQGPFTHSFFGRCYLFSLEIGGYFPSLNLSPAANHLIACHFLKGFQITDTVQNPTADAGQARGILKEYTSL